MTNDEPLDMEFEDDLTKTTLYSGMPIGNSAVTDSAVALFRLCLSGLRACNAAIQIAKVQQSTPRSQSTHPSHNHGAMMVDSVEHVHLNPEVSIISYESTCEWVTYYVHRTIHRLRVSSASARVVFAALHALTPLYDLLLSSSTQSTSPSVSTQPDPSGITLATLRQTLTRVKSNLARDILQWYSHNMSSPQSPSIRQPPLFMSTPPTPTERMDAIRLADSLCSIIDGISTPSPFLLVSSSEASNSALGRVIAFFNMLRVGLPPST